LAAVVPIAAASRNAKRPAVSNVKPAKRTANAPAATDGDWDEF